MHNNSVEMVYGVEPEVEIFVMVQPMGKGSFGGKLEARAKYMTTSTEGRVVVELYEEPVGTQGGAQRTVGNALSEEQFQQVAAELTAVAVQRMNRRMQEEMEE